MRPAFWTVLHHARARTRFTVPVRPGRRAALFVGDTFYPAPLYTHHRRVRISRPTATSAHRLAAHGAGGENTCMPGHNVGRVGSEYLVRMALAFDAVAAGTGRFRGHRRQPGVSVRRLSRSSSPAADSGRIRLSRGRTVCFQRGLGAGAAPGSHQSPLMSSTVRCWRCARTETWQDAHAPDRRDPTAIILNPMVRGHVRRVRHRFRR